jgi:aspartate/methionine/tyrosine aminotransferase
MTFGGVENTLLHEIIGDVPGISMKGISKDVPWPGSRCGWIEAYNTDKDKNFCDYFNVLLLAKMLEVCSTALPQKVLPSIYAHDEFKPLLQARIQKYEQRADEAYQFFSKIPQVRINKPRGVFYLVVELLNLPYAKLTSENEAIRHYLDTLEDGAMKQDFQFSYELMGSKNICVVPLSGFGSDLTGFRMTLLQNNDVIYTETLNNIGSAIEEYYGKEDA